MGSVGDGNNRCLDSLSDGRKLNIHIFHCLAMKFQLGRPFVFPDLTYLSDLRLGVTMSTLVYWKIIDKYTTDNFPFEQYRGLSDLS